MWRHFVKRSGLHVCARCVRLEPSSCLPPACLWLKAPNETTPALLQQSKRQQIFACFVRVTRHLDTAIGAQTIDDGSGRIDTISTAQALALSPIPNPPPQYIYILSNNTTIGRGVQFPWYVTTPIGELRKFRAYRFRDKGSRQPHAEVLLPGYASSDLNANICEDTN